MLEPGRNSKRDPVSGSGEFTEADIAELLASLRSPGTLDGGDLAPRPGFYGRLVSRIEADQKRSIWSVFLEPVFGTRLALASAGLMALLAVVLLSTPSQTADEMAQQDIQAQSTQALAFAEPLAITEDGQPAQGVQATPVSLHQMNEADGRNVVLVDLASYRGQ